VKQIQIHIKITKIKRYTFTIFFLISKMHYVDKVGLVEHVRNANISLIETCIDILIPA